MVDVVILFRPRWGKETPRLSRLRQLLREVFTFLPRIPNDRMIKVQVRPNEPLEAALRRFKRQCH